MWTRTKILFIVFAFMFVIKLHSQTPKHRIELGVLAGYNYYLWDVLQDYKRVNSNNNFSYGLMLNFNKEKYKVSLFIQREKQNFSNIRTGPIFNSGTIIKREIQCTNATLGVGLSNRIFIRGKCALFLDNSILLTKLLQCKYETTSQNSVVTKKEIFTDTLNKKILISNSISFEYKLNRLSLRCTIGLQSTIKNLELQDEQGRDVLNFNSRVAIISRLVVSYSLF